jgi:hypothetical protein
MMRATAKAPPAAPPAIAATGGPSFFGVMVAAASFVAVTTTLDAPETVVDNVLEGCVKLDARDALEVEALLLLTLLELKPATAPYSFFRKSVPMYAGVRSFVAQPPGPHGFVLQQPKKGGLLSRQV